MSNEMHKPSVRILSTTERIENICAAAARISTTAGVALEIYENSFSNENNSSLMGKVLSSGHKSFIEHAYFNIAFNNVSVIIEQFLIEFRLPSFTIKSRRYVDFSKMGFHTPEFSNQEITEKYKKHMSKLFEAYEIFIQNGIPKEDARFILPYCYRSNFYLSCNARELLHILYSMLYGKGSANAEIRNLGEELLAQLNEICPAVLSGFGETKTEKEDKLSFLKSIFKDVPNNKSSGVVKSGAKLLNYTRDFERNIAVSALISAGYSEESVSEVLKENIFEEIVKTVMQDRRSRELEHGNFTFAVKDISLAGLTHLERHRIQSLVVPSVYTAIENNRYILPDSIGKDQKLKELYINSYEENRERFDEFREMGLTEAELSYFALSGNTVDAVTTMNGREILLFTKLRTCARAQWEIREISMSMLNQLREIYPTIFNHFGPSCYVNGKCPEGKLTCGKQERVKKQFTKFS